MEDFRIEDPSFLDTDGSGRAKKLSPPDFQMKKLTGAAAFLSYKIQSGLEE